jgi:hypothetical protein
MIRKLFGLTIIIAFFAVTSCVKETYEMNKLSKKAHLSPTFAVSAVKGNISLSDLIDPSDTIIFDEDNFIRIVFKEDSVIDFGIDEYENLDSLGEFHLNEAYAVFGVAVNNVEDTITFEPGDDIEIVKIGIDTGIVNYRIISKSLAPASFTITLPTVKIGGTPITHIINIPALQTVTGSVSLNSAEVDLSTDPKKVFNRLPVTYSISVTSGSFSLLDSMLVQLDIPSPDFDYVKGYFGQQSEVLVEDTLDLEIKEILDHISGTFLISEPSITMNYKNSFSVPVEVNIEAVGHRLAETVDLNLAPQILSYPAAPGQRDIEGSFTIDKESNLPALISMPPEKITFSGSAEMNPGGNDGLRNNYIFEESRFLGNLEIEVPLEFRFNNLQFTDTIDNFMMNEDQSSDNPFKPENFEFLRVRIDAENGFPLGVSLSLILHDSASGENLCVINASDILTPAPVDVNGKVTAPSVSTADIDITKEFWESVNVADKIIFKFTLNSTDSGSKDVKIYSDYKIDFKAALILKPDIQFNLK